MEGWEFYSAMRALPRRQKRFSDLRLHGSDFTKALQKYLEAVITVHGHAWCMDVKSERVKMAKLITEAIQSDLEHLNGSNGGK